MDEQKTAIDTETTGLVAYAEPDPEKNPAEYKRWVKNQVRRGLMPRFKIEVTKVKTGNHPKQHRLEYKLQSTVALLTAPTFTDPGFEPMVPPAKGPTQCSRCYGVGKTSIRKAGALRLKPCKACEGTGIRPVAQPAPAPAVVETPAAQEAAPNA